MLPRGIQTKRGLLSFSTIHQRFSATHHGKTLISKSRYGKYKPEYIPDEMWQKFLGPDSNNLHHIYVAYLISREYLKAHPEITSRNRQILLLAAITHDWGEAVTGDILVPFKTADHTATEKSILKDLLYDYLGDVMAHDVLDSVPEIVFDSGTELGTHFRHIEEWGYVRTSLRAWQKSLLTDDEHLRHRFRILVYSVFAYDLQNVIIAARQCRAIHTHLSVKAEAIITHVCDTMPHDMYKHHIHPDQTEWARVAFARAVAEWKQFKKL